MESTCRSILQSVFVCPEECNSSLTPDSLGLHAQKTVSNLWKQFFSFPRLHVSQQTHTSMYAHTHTHTHSQLHLQGKKELHKPFRFESQSRLDHLLRVSFPFQTSLNWILSDCGVSAINTKPKCQSHRLAAVCVTKCNSMCLHVWTRTLSSLSFPISHTAVHPSLQRFTHQLTRGVLDLKGC